MSIFSAYLFLLLAIGFEVAGTSCMKLSNGFTRLMPSVVMPVCYMASFCFLTLRSTASMSARHMPSGPALASLAAERATRAEVSRIREAADAFDECTEDIVRRRMADAPLHTLIAEISRSEDLL